MKLPEVALALLFATMTACASGQSQAPGTLSVSRTGRGPMYIEGSVPFFRVEREGGVIVEEKRLGQSPVVGVGGSFSFSLPPANYVLVTYVRPCDGTCEHLDPPADECRGAFSIKSGQTLYAVRQQTDSGACSVTFSE